MRLRSFAHAVACALVAAPLLFAQDRPPAEAYALDLAKNVKDVARQSIPKTVAIEIHIGDRMGYGSGAIISADGYILSCAHVIEPGSKLVAVTPDGRRHDVTKIGINSKNDYGLLKIDAGGALPFFDLGNSSALKEGDWVVALGHPGGPYQDLKPAVAVGRVRGMGRQLPIGFGDKFYKNAILTDCPIFAGNSGGPLVDRDGRLVGINGAILLVNENAYASSIDEIKADMEAMRGGEEIEGEGYEIWDPRLWKVMQDLQKEIAPEDMQKLYDRSPIMKIVQQLMGEQAQRPERKVVVSLDARTPQEGGELVFRSVEPQGTLGAAGVRSGDVLVSIDGFPVRSEQQLKIAMLEFVEGQSVDVVVKREGEVRTVSAQFSAKGTQRQALLTYSFNRLGKLVGGSTVMVREGAENGYGVILDESYVLTCDHILGEQAREVRVRLSSGIDLPAKVIGRDGSLDVAILKVDLRGQSFVPARLGRSAALEPGDWILCGGSSRGPVTVGAVSAMGRSITTPRRVPAMGLFGMLGEPNESPLRPYPEVFQHDAPLAKGLFGTGAFNTDGELVGLNVALWYRGSSYAVPIERIATRIEAMKQGEFVEQPAEWRAPNQAESLESLYKKFFGGGNDDDKRESRRNAPAEPVRKGEGFIGVAAEPDNGDQLGVQVKSVEDGMPAQKAGVQSGDLIVKVGEQRVHTRADLVGTVSGLAPGTHTTITVIRGTGEDKRSITLEIDIERIPKQK